VGLEGGLVGRGEIELVEVEAGHQLRQVLVVRHAQLRGEHLHQPSQNRRQSSTRGSGLMGSS
jgi:hypothetical protein